MGNDSHTFSLTGFRNPLDPEFVGCQIVSKAQKGGDKIDKVKLVADNQDNYSRHGLSHLVERNKEGHDWRASRYENEKERGVLSTLNGDINNFASLGLYCKLMHYKCIVDNDINDGVRNQDLCPSQLNRDASVDRANGLDPCSAQIAQRVRILRVRAARFFRLQYQHSTQHIQGVQNRRALTVLPLRSYTQLYGYDTPYSRNICPMKAWAAWHS
ncbi:hypothetical protein AG1IA_04701 [Rhizoctonia solani AG-1 IA]|uniref:Uncharacterized protein n=1 Tax=Thanatephorus cucumeris (strain AG1-IA) TaxID=983506 RepID=L8WT55_THACA|nr:hypothetical protein AG1IA_04701 [Rhizoctonia solani AG-1 IA]